MTETGDGVIGTRSTVGSSTSGKEVKTLGPGSNIIRIPPPPTPSGLQVQGKGPTGGGAKAPSSATSGDAPSTNVRSDGPTQDGDEQEQGEGSGAESEVWEEKKEKGKLTRSILGIFKKDDSVSRIKKLPKKVVNETPSTEGEWKLVKTIILSDQHVKVNVFLDERTSDYIYHPVEPFLAPKQKELLDFIRDTLNRALKYRKEAFADKDQKDRFLDEEVKTILRDYGAVLGGMNEEFLDPVMYYIHREYVGYGKIESIMLDPGVEDVSCDGTNIPVFVYHRDYGSIKTTIVFEKDEELEGFVVSLAQRAGRSISVALPILDATLPEGHRLNATFGREVTTRGSSFTIRKFKEDPLTITDLVKYGTVSNEMAAHFWLSVQYGDSIIFAGGTASGKTATMNAISIFIPTSAKIISIEDTREVNLPHQNWIAGITRGSAEGTKDTDIDMYQLLRAALRQRPEYVLVGEVRGKETMTMFQAMATGHITYSTMHADSVKSIVYRLENPPISIPRVLIQALNLVAIHNQLRVRGKRVRRITELVEIVGIEPTSLEIITNRVYKWEPAGDKFVFGGHSNLYEKIMDIDDMTRDEVVNELNRRAEIIDWLVINDIRKFKDVNLVVVEYYEDPEKVIKLIRENRKVDISMGLHLFDQMIKDRLPRSKVQAPPPTPQEKPAEGQGVALATTTGGA